MGLKPIEPYDEVRSTDSGHFKADIKEIKADVKEMKSDFIDLKIKTSEMYRDLNGNGKDGLLKVVDDHCKYIDTQTGGISAIKFMIGVSGINGLILIGVAIKLFS